MARKLLESSAVSAFCGSLATMIAAGIQTDEAVLMLAENREKSRFRQVCQTIYERLIAGDKLAEAMEASKAFTRYAVGMVATGERSGHLEQVLRTLDLYYDEEDRMFSKLQSSIGYPAALLVIMSIILAFTVALILPVFVGVYDNMAGSLVSGSYSVVGASIVIGYVAFGLTIVFTVIALVLALECRTERGRQRVLGLFGHLPSTRKAIYQLALARFCAALATYMSSGITNEEAMTRAIDTVDHARLRRRLVAAHDSMVDLNNPRSLPQAFAEQSVFEPLYTRMLAVDSRSGSADVALSRLSQTFFEDAIAQIDRAIDQVEPLLAALLTLAVGATLVAVMLPLIGIMGSIG